MKTYRVGFAKERRQVHLSISQLSPVVIEDFQVSFSDNPSLESTIYVSGIMDVAFHLATKAVPGILDR